MLWKNSFFKLKAGALSYAISIVLLLSMLSSALIFINRVYTQVSSISLLKEHLVFDNLLALKVGANSDKSILFHYSGDTSEIKKMKWGVFEVLTVRTHLKNAAIEKTALIGKMYDCPKHSLYVNEHREPISLGGQISILGDCKIAEKGFEKTTIAGKVYDSKNRIKGKSSRSDYTLPEIDDEYKNLNFLNESDNCTRLNEPLVDSNFSFKHKTTLYEKDSIIEIENKLSGNLIIHSFDSIIVRRNAFLENVILVSPVIVFESGFKGRLQAQASERIVCNDSVELLFPSVLILNEMQNTEMYDQNHTIRIGQNTKILGGILMVMQEPSFRTPIKLFVRGGLIYGFVYNQGDTELQGKIVGCLFTNDVIVQETNYYRKSCLVDASIDSENLPIQGLCVNWLKERKFQNIKLLS